MSTFYKEEGMTYKVIVSIEVFKDGEYHSRPFAEEEVVEEKKLEDATDRIDRIMGRA